MDRAGWSKLFLHITVISKSIYYVWIYCMYMLPHISGLLHDISLTVSTRYNIYSMYTTLDYILYVLACCCIFFLARMRCVHSYLCRCVAMRLPLPVIPLFLPSTIPRITDAKSNKHKAQFCTHECLT